MLGVMKSRKSFSGLCSRTPFGGGCLPSLSADLLWYATYRKILHKEAVGTLKNFELVPLDGGGVAKYEFGEE